MKIYRCKHCGQIIKVIKPTGVPLVCCGEEMEEIIAGSTDAAVEKHVPVVEVKGNNVHVVVGSVEHPMTEAHFIEWISLKTKQGCQMKKLKPLEKPEVFFALAEGDEVVECYAYCNLHGLWKSE